ncbi:unnamed protein product [Blepharisma stoltei]|uniref:J domain-containing protein n=1 Tax=Blepharisma stoltei TaxID=1481888 RepID=A0AAU9IND9_9CILI|nr:unnamed protein product [Blepharisma stoltei]
MEFKKQNATNSHPMFTRFKQNQFEEENSLASLTRTPNIPVSINPMSVETSYDHLYQNTGPNGVNIQNSQEALPKIKFQRQIYSAATKRANPAFQRWLEHKYGNDLYYSSPAPNIPVKRKRTPNFLMKNLYDLMGLKPNCSEADIKKAYKKLAIKHHPDKGGCAKYFRCLKQAYDILSNEDLKEVYDNEGLIGVNMLGQIECDELLEYLKNSDADPIADLQINDANNGNKSELK